MYAEGASYLAPMLAHLTHKRASLAHKYRVLQTRQLIDKSPGKRMLTSAISLE